MSDKTGSTPAATRADEHTLAEAFVQRMTWPSMHWQTQRIDFDAALALAKVALDHAPDILATARIKEQALANALADAKAVTR